MGRARGGAPLPARPRAAAAAGPGSTRSAPRTRTSPSSGAGSRGPTSRASASTASFPPAPGTSRRSTWPSKASRTRPIPPLRRRSSSTRCSTRPWVSLVLLFAIATGTLPSLMPSLPAFDLAFWADHPRFALFAITLVTLGLLVLYAVLSVRAVVFWNRIAGCRDPHGLPALPAAGRRLDGAPPGCCGSPGSTSSWRRSTSAARSRTRCW